MIQACCTMCLCHWTQYGGVYLGMEHLVKLMHGHFSITLKFWSVPRTLTQVEMTWGMVKHRNAVKHPVKPVWPCWYCMDNVKQCLEARVYYTDNLWHQGVVEHLLEILWHSSSLQCMNTLIVCSTGSNTNGWNTWILQTISVIWYFLDAPKQLSLDHINFCMAYVVG